MITEVKKISQNFAQNKKIQSLLFSQHLLVNTLGRCYCFIGRSTIHRWGFLVDRLVQFLLNHWLSDNRFVLQHFLQVHNYKPSTLK